VLRGVDLAVAPGEMVALLGASGAGKSTLLHLLGLLDRPTEGEVLYDGRPVQTAGSRQKARLRNSHVGFVFQFYHLIPELTALQNAMLGSMMTGGLLTYLRTRGGLRERARATLAELGLEPRLHHKPSALSGGERQRVAIARALMAQPKVILADEPTGNLDSSTAGDVLDILFRINRDQGIAFVLVTHNEELAARCSRVIRMRDGVIEG